MASEADILRMYDPPTECGDGRCTDLFQEFLYCVIVPCSILVLICLIIAIVACCKSKACRCKKYSALNTQSAVELEDYNSVRRASLNLRQMSRNRETPMMGSRAGSMTLDRSHRRYPRNRDSCSSLPGTLQRQYRNRRADRNASSMLVPSQYGEDTNGSVNGISSHPMSGISYDDDVQIPPPPPPYRSQEEDVFTQSGFLQVSMHSSVTYDDNSDTNGSGAQPLLGQHPYRGGQHSNMSYSSHNQW